MRVFRNLMLGWAMFIALFGVGVISLLILFPPGEAIYRTITGNACDGGETHSTTIDVADATVLRVLGGRGDLSVEGRGGLTAVQIEGQTCARLGLSRHLESIAFSTSHVGDEIIISVDMPRQASGELIDGIRMDLVILVPENIPRLDIDIEKGTVSVNNIRELQAFVGFGRLDATGIGGNVEISSIEGSVAMTNVQGDVKVDAIKSYGVVRMIGVGGNVVIGDNSSGPASISDVGGDVTIGSAGTGSLTVSKVAGDLSVGSNPRGDITVSQVEGSVRIPGDEERSGT